MDNLDFIFLFGFVGGTLFGYFIRHLQALWRRRKFAIAMREKEEAQALRLDAIRFATARHDGS